MKILVAETAVSNVRFLHFESARIGYLKGIRYICFANLTLETAVAAILVFLSFNLKAQIIQETPNLEFVCELKVKVDKAQTIGKTAHGIRRFVPITGGSFEGPKIKGTVLNGGADYQFVNAENTRTEIEAIYTLQTHDSVLIHIRNVGLVVKTPEQAGALAKGETVDRTKLYFRAAPKFEAPMNSSYTWLNDALFISRGLSGEAGFVRIQVWKIL